MLKEKANKIENDKKNHKKIIDSKVFEIEQKLKKDLYVELTQKINEENKTKNDLFKKELERKNKELENLKNSEHDFEKSKLNLKQNFSDEISKIKRNHLKELQIQSEKAKKLVNDENQLKIRELEKQLNDQKRLTDEQKRKLEQGSMQIQGEVQEEAIEEFLKKSFPLDSITEIKKGVKGADCLQIVNSRETQNCGLIYYESKRTKNFSKEWISKFKNDMQDKNADIGVLVTKTLPQGFDRMSINNGVYICTFDEFKGLSHVLRNVILEYNRIKISQDNIGDKKELLYEFLTSNEFQSIMENFVELFKSINSDYEKEYNQAITNFERRRGRLESLKKLIFSIFGRFSGIAGNSIKKLDIEKPKDKKKSNVELLRSLSNY